MPDASAPRTTLNGTKTPPGGDAVRRAPNAADFAMAASRVREIEEHRARQARPDESDLPDLRKKPLKLQVLEKSVEIAGFGSVMRAWRAEGNTFRNVMKSLGSKAADMLAGRMVSMTFRLFAITWVAGMIGGVSTWGTLALLAAATGAASSIYTYHKEYLGDRLKARKNKDMKVKFFDRQRMKKSLLAFAGGFAGGGFGLWLAKTEIFQNFLGVIKDIFSPAAAITDKFNVISAIPETAAAPGQAIAVPDTKLTSHFTVATNAEARLDAPTLSAVAKPVPQQRFGGLDGFMAMPLAA